MFLKLRKPLAFFDLETTGINITKDRIVEMSILKLMPDGTKKGFTQRFNPGIPIPLESSLVHGIYDKDVADKPYFADMAGHLKVLLSDCDLGGYNLVRFDVPLLVEEFLRADIDFNIDDKYIVDAQKIFHLMEPRTLSAAYKFYCNKELDGAHGAEADTVASYEVFEAQIKKYEGQAIKDENGKEYVPIHNDMKKIHDITFSKQVDLANRIKYNKQGIEVFNFGKFKDVPVVEAFKREPGFYEWMMNADFPLETKKRLTEIKLKNFTQRQ